MLKRLLQFAFLFPILAGILASAQTFEINGQSQSSPSRPAKKRTSKAATAQATPSEPNASAPPQSGIGWGSGIEVARNARAAQQALDKNNYNDAVTYATRAANAAPQSTPLWFLVGYAARLAGQYQVSLNAYQRGLKNEPSSVPGLSGLAQTYARMGRDSEARDVLNKILALNPKSANDLALAGELSLNSDPQTALDLLKRADALRPSARNDLLIARAYQRLSKPDQAKQFLDRAQNREPNNPDVLRAIAAFYRDSGQYDQAVATLQKIKAKNPDSMAELGYTYQLAGKRKESAESYAKAADESPRSTGLQLSAAQALVNVGQLDAAGKFLDRASSSDANNYRLHAIRGQIASLQNQNEDAIKEYRFSLDHMPSAVPEGPLYPVSIHLSLAEAYRGIDDSAAAAREVAAARTAIGQVTQIQDSSRPEFLRLRAVIEIASDERDAAERDLKQALSLDPNSVNIILNYANLLWRVDRKQEAVKMYNQALEKDPVNQSGLTALGYLSREVADAKTAERYFLKVRSLYPRDYVSYLALGDLYTSAKEFEKAQENYEKAHELAPTNPLVVAGGINSALEAHKLPIAKSWVDRAVGTPLEQNPQVMREHERYLTFAGQYDESARLGYKVLEKLPSDPEAPVYLAYDLLYLNRYEEAFAVVQKYEPVLPKDKDLHLIAGYVHTHNGDLRDAVDEFTKAIELAPSVATSYVNRGYVLNDMRRGSEAVKDFEAAIRLRPEYAEAHLGLAFANLQSQRAKQALKEVNIAAKLGGESKSTHLARAEAYRQQVMLRQAEEEYEAAIKLAPNDVALRLAAADALYGLHRYAESIDLLKGALNLGSDDAVIYAHIARDYAQLHDRDNAVRMVTEAEKRGSNSSKVLMATGETMLILGEHSQAMDRYGRALDAPDTDRVEIRLALARLFAAESRRNEAAQQISLGFAEARIGEADPVTPSNLLEAGRIFMATGEFELAKRYFERAQANGADERIVAIGLANAYLALGETQSADQLLRSVGNTPDVNQDYDYLIAVANVYQQEHDTVRALSAFARANRMVSGNDYAERTELALAGEEGDQITNMLSAQSEASFGPIFEDINIYTMDARLRGVANISSLLPPPRSSLETRADARYRIHLNGFPIISGLVEERNAQGTLSFPSQLLIQYRNTYDTIFNGQVTPVFHLGAQTIAVSPGLQFTIRRDTSAPQGLNQNLFRQFVYLYTSPFANWISISGSLTREAGPFTEENLHSRDLSASVNFVVGRPWAKTALITGYQARDLLFRPSIHEYFSTDSYVGIRRKFGENLKVSVFAEYLRSWRVEGTNFAIAQALRPAFEAQYLLNRNWSLEASGTWSRGEGYHVYDNTSNQIMVTYVRPLQRRINDGFSDVPVNYPLRFSAGLQQQTFYNFPGSNSNTFLPVIRLGIF